MFSYLLINRKLVASLFLSVPILLSTNAIADDMTLTEIGGLMKRPDWLPELPKLETMGFAPDTAIYLKLRKRIIEQNDKKAIPQLYDLAKNSHVQSIVLMGYLYDQKPKLIPTNSKYAAQYWQKSAKSGDPVSIYNLGILYLNGRGVPKDTATARKLFQLASNKGSFQANYILGQMDETNKSYTSAMSNYSKCLGVNYLPQCKTRHSINAITRTKLTPKEAQLAVKRLTDASSSGDLEATYTLARLAAEGVVINKSHSTMVYYLELMVKSPKSNTHYKTLAANMYRAYNPSNQDISLGKEKYAKANAGNALYPKLASYQPIDPTKTILDTGGVLR